MLKPYKTGKILFQKLIYEYKIIINVYTFKPLYTEGYVRDK